MSNPVQIHVTSNAPGPGYLWQIIDILNSHCLAQGLANTEEAAMIEAAQARFLLPPSGSPADPNGR